MQTYRLSAADPRQGQAGAGAGRGLRRPRPRITPPSAAASRTDQPVWTGAGPVSWLVNRLINTPSIYNVMKAAARNAIKGGAEKQGVAWDAHVAALGADLATLEAIQAELYNATVQYPEYYLKPFHAYEQGNLCWQAAQEVDPATYAMALRTFKTEPLTPDAAFAKLRTSITGAVQSYLKAQGLRQPRDIVDFGCATGMSTRWLADTFPDAHVTGIDLSTYFLAVAERFERQKPGGSRRIRYLHGLAERSGLPPSSVDLVSFQFVVHECPEPVIRDFLTEARRILRPGGVLFITDNDPRSETIKGLPPVLATLMKSTEPHSDSYFSMDLEAAMKDAGFCAVTYRPTDHRHRTVMATA